MRGPGRDDDPVAAMWNAVLAGVVFQHPSIEALIRELGRNPALLQACGFAVLPVQKKPAAHLVRDPVTGHMTVVYAAPQEAHDAVPASWNFSRFLANVIELEETLGMVTGMIKTLREQLMDVLPEFGRHLGYDGKAIESHSTGRVNRTTGETSDPDADWGKHQTSDIDARTGKPWKKIKTWFGYGVHLIADTQSRNSDSRCRCARRRSRARVRLRCRRAPPGPARAVPLTPVPARPACVASRAGLRG